jgi:hypothetical protein
MEIILRKPKKVTVMALSLSRENTCLLQEQHPEQHRHQQYHQLALVDEANENDRSVSPFFVWALALFEKEKEMETRPPTTTTTTTTTLCQDLQELEPILILMYTTPSCTI